MWVKCNVHGTIKKKERSSFGHSEVRRGQGRVSNSKQAIIRVITT